MKRAQRGFSLLELMFTLLLIGVVAAIGLPTMQTTVRRNQVSTEVNRLLSDLLFARNSAVTRGRVVTLCRSNDQSTCGGGATGQYDVGWITYMATGPRIGYSAGAGFELLKVGDPASTNLQIRSSGAQAPTYISFQPNGRIDPAVAGAISVSVCYNGTSTVQVPGKRVVLSVSGRPNVTDVPPGGC